MLNDKNKRLSLNSDSNVKIKGNDQYSSVEQNILTLNHQYGNSINLVNQESKRLNDALSQKSLFPDSDEKTKTIDQITFQTTLINENDKKLLVAMCIGCRDELPKLKLIHSDSCNHNFCKDCFKQIFQYSIENGHKTRKCPVKYCLEILPLSVFKSNLPDVHYNYLAMNDDSSIRDTIDMLISMKAKSEDQMKKIEHYLSSNVLDINTNENMYIVRMVKKNICPICLIPDLFNRKDMKFSLCLNCIQYFCNFCFNLYTEGHFKKKNKWYCKVYFRQEPLINIRNGRKYWKLIIFQLLALVVGFIICCCGLYSYINNIWLWVFCISNAKIVKCKSIRMLIIHLLTTICYLIFLPFMLLGLPYFPLILVITN